MKKTMFITSVIMVVVLAIALTTSSLAWFTAGGAQTVRVDTVTITAASAQAAGPGLEINHTAEGTGSWYTTSPVQLNAETRANNKPAAVLATKEGEKLSHQELYNALSTAVSTPASTELGLKGSKSLVIEGTEYFKEGAYAVTPYNDYVWIRNTGYQQCAVSCSITDFSTGAVANETGNHDAVIWVAVFDVTNTSSVKLLALENSRSLSTMAFTTSYASFAADTATSLMTGINPSTGIDTKVNTSLEAGSDQTGADGVAFVPGTAHKIMVFSWFDGVSLIGQNTDTVVTFKLSFSIVNS